MNLFNVNTKLGSTYLQLMFEFTFCYANVVNSNNMQLIVCVLIF